MRLYQSKNQMVTLNYKNFNKMDLLTELITLLGLPEDSTEADVTQAVTDLLKQVENADKEKEENAEKLVNYTISKGVINAGQKASYLSLFKADYESTKSVLEGLLSNGNPQPSKELSEFLTRIPSTGSYKDLRQDTRPVTEKPKNEWNLDDYRRHAPQELQKNQKLYRELVKKEFGDTED